jgi:hypothetical protein
LLLGAACVTQPGRVLAVIGGPDRDDASTRTVVRVLGGRLVAQAAADLVVGPRTRRLDLVVDLTHAATMIAAAWRWPEHRRSASLRAGAAAATALLDAGGRRAGRTP